MATNETNTGTLQPKTDQAVAPRGSNSERFTAKVMKEFGSSAGVPQVTDFQRQLIQGYFISIDRALKAAEEERLRKNANNKDHKYDNDLPVTWENVNLTDLALDVVHYARMGLDMMQDNHLFPIPYKNNKAQRYDVTLMPGYNGIRYIAEKYALDPPWPSPWSWSILRTPSSLSRRTPQTRWRAIGSSSTSPSTGVPWWVASATSSTQTPRRMSWSL